VKVYAQSSVPTHMPYLHIGYLAATAADVYGFQIFVFSLILTALGTFLFVKYRRIREHVSWFSFRRGSGKRYPAWATGIVLVVLGGLGFATMPFLGKIRIKTERFTQSRIARVMQVLAEDLADGRPLLDDVRALRAAHAFGADAFIDAWDRDLRITWTAIDGEPVCIITSAGPDGKFDTQDDIRSDPREFARVVKHV